MNEGVPEAVEAGSRPAGRTSRELPGWRGKGLEWLNRLRLPGPSVLPVAGAVVGLYGGLAAGVFTNLIGTLGGLVFGWPQVADAFHGGSSTRTALKQSLAEAPWHLEYLIVGVPLALAALGLTRLIPRRGAREVVRKRLRILALLALGALALYYPLVALAAVNAVFGHSTDLLGALRDLPAWARLLVPALGGAVVGGLLKSHPTARGHGVPEVVAAVRRDPEVLTAHLGLRKLIASAVTIGSGGSAGREGPIVYGGAAFGSAVGRTLGFTRKELSVLLAAGAGAGIAASFNTPIGGAVFALEIILREFELNVFSPIFLASVTATMVSRGVMGTAAMLQRVPYEIHSGWEILAYAALGLLTGWLAHVFIRLLRFSESFFEGRRGGRLSAFMGRRSLPSRAALGGLVVGALAFLSPTVWGVGHESLNLATAQKLSLTALAVACVLKLLATCITLGSGGSGGTFFPAVVIGGMGGGVMGELLQRLAPGAGIHSGAYALVGMGGCVAGFTRGPLTGLVMMYELSGSASVILPLMVTCTIASALCHALVQRHLPHPLTEQEVLRQTALRAAMVRCQPLSAGLHLGEVFDRLVGSEAGALPVCDESGRVLGLAQVEDLRGIWSERDLDPLLVARDLLRPIEVVDAGESLAEGLDRMDRADLDALPVIDPGRKEFPDGVVTRTAIQRVVRRTLQRSELLAPMAPTEEA